MQNVAFGSLNSLSRCIYPVWHTPRTVFILQSTSWSQNYCFILLDNRRKKNQNPKPQQYLTERNNSMRLQYMIHEVTNNKNSKWHTINITVLEPQHKLLPFSSSTGVKSDHPKQFILLLIIKQTEEWLNPLVAILVHILVKTWAGRQKQRTELSPHNPGGKL